jgi:hypothetical protein
LVLDVSGALDALTAMIKATNTYLAKKQETAAVTAANGSDGVGLQPAGPQPLLLRKAAAYVTRILSVFGLLQVCDALWTLNMFKLCSNCLCRQAVANVASGQPLPTVLQPLPTVIQPLPNAYTSAGVGDVVPCHQLL